MRDFKKRRTAGGELLHIGAGTAGILLLCAVAFVAVRGAWGMYGKFAGAAEARATAEAQLAALTVRYETVAEDVEALQSERGIEAQVRQRYGVARQGEGQIDIVRQAPQEEVAVEHPTLWDRLWQLLFVW